MKKFSEPAQPDVLINDMVVPFLLAHWRELIRGVTVPARFAAVSRLETVAVKFVKEAEGTHAGRPVMIIRLELANRLLTPFLKPVRFTIEKEGRHRIWEYSGRTTPRVLKSGKWVELDALTVFDWD